MSEMRAAQFDRFGPPEVLYTGMTRKPEVKPGEVLVRVHGSSVNGGELVLRSGRMGPLLGRKFPKRIGVDFAGEVVAVGSGVAHPEVGEHVWGGLPWGRFGATAEFVSVRPGQLSLSPAGLDLVRAGALPAVGTTAITALRDQTHLKPGERLLVRGGSGGAGSAMIQLGKALGAHVTALAGAKNLDFVREVGADEAFDYATTGPADLGKFDVVVDTVGSELRGYRRLLAPGGRMVTIRPGSPGEVAYLLASTVFGSRRVRIFFGNPRHQLFADLTRYVESGAISPIVDTVHPLAEVAEAHRALERGGVRGKHVIQLV